jgi:hypothetical protein
LTGPQEQQFEQDRFIPVWKEYAGKTDYSTLSAANAVPFMRELMSLSIEDRLKLQEFSNKHNKSHSIVQKVEKSDEEIEADKEDAFEKQVAALHEK